MADKIVRLLFSSEPHDDESFLGYLLRLAELNRVPTVSWILRLANIRDYLQTKISSVFNKSLNLALALHYYRRGFESVKAWLWSLFDEYVDIGEEVRHILEPAPDDSLTKSVRGALQWSSASREAKSPPPPWN
jgi:hypothetical protein